MAESERAQGTVRFLRYESELLKDNAAGDPHGREVAVYLPPNYDAGDQRFPSVYCLTGFTGRGRMLVNDSPLKPNLAERMDRLIAEGRSRPMILVMPDCFTRYGGSQYINSSATGPYEDYLTREIVPFVDAELRTVASRDSRGVAGHSSGGYGALMMGMRHADLFGAVCCQAGDAYFEYSLLADMPKAVRAIKGDPQAFIERFWSDEKRSGSDFAALNIIGMSACYSPNGKGFDLPFDLSTGELRPEVWRRWLEKDPVRLLEKYAEPLKTLRLLYLDAGTRDEFGLDIGARILSDRLQKAGVPHIHEEFDDGHMNTSYRYNRSLELLSQHLL